MSGIKAEKVLIAALYAAAPTFCLTVHCLYVHILVI